MGPAPVMLSCFILTSSRKSSTPPGSPGTPWSGQARKWYCHTVRSVLPYNIRQITNVRETYLLLCFGVCFGTILVLTLPVQLLTASARAGCNHVPKFPSRSAHAWLRTLSEQPRQANTLHTYSVEESTMYLRIFQIFHTKAVIYSNKNTGCRFQSEISKNFPEYFAFFFF